MRCPDIKQDKEGNCEAFFSLKEPLKFETGAISAISIPTIGNVTSELSLENGEEREKK